MSLGHVTGEKEIDPRAGAQRILSSQAGSEPFGKFSTLHDFSTTYKLDLLTRHDPI